MLLVFEILIVIFIILVIIVLFELIMYKLYWIPSPENIPLDKGQEFFFRKKSKKAALLIHGFTSTTQELRELGEYLADKNITVYAPLVAGHGTKLEDLEKTRLNDWYKSVEKALLKLKKESKVKEIYLVGASLGGNLVFMLAQKYKVNAIISLGTPVIHKKYFFLKYVNPIVRLFTKYQLKHYNKDDWKIAKKKVHYSSFPLSCTNDVLKCMNITKNILKRTKIPVLIMQSTRDYQLGEKNAKYIYKNIGSKRKRLIFIPDSYHVFIMDKYKDMVVEEIYRFIKEN